MMHDIEPMEELRAIRKELLAEFGGSPLAYAEYLRSLDEKTAKKTKTGKVDGGHPVDELHVAKPPQARKRTPRKAHAR